MGRGLGNKFLDDLRHADALIHMVDVSGCTDAEGKETRGYDPSHDIVWLRGEIVRWVLGNLMEKWGAIKRRHTAVSESLSVSATGRYAHLVVALLQKRQLLTRYKTNSRATVAMRKSWRRYLMSWD